MRSKDFLSYRLDGILNGLSNAVVVAPGIINLQHRKLRGVGLIDALITEVAVDLKDLIDTTNDSPLEEKLRSDTQVQINIKRVRVRDEWARCCTTVQGQIGRASCRERGEVAGGAGAVRRRERRRRKR